MRIGTIGTGYIVRAFLNGAIANKMQLEAVYSRNKKSGEKLANEYQTTKVYTDLEEMLNDSNIDLIYIASPNSLHYSQTLKALKHGKHVITEKPFTSTTKELEILIKTAKEKNLFLFEAITNIHLPNFKLIKEEIKKLGNIKFIQCNYSQYSSKYDAFLRGENPNVFNPEFSGGALYDINIYNLHFVVKLFGKPTKINYFANKHSNGIDTSGVLILNYNDFIAECVGAKDTKSQNFAQIQGEKGYLYVTGGANGCQEFKTIIGDKEEIFNQQTIKNPLYYENVAFIDIIQRNAYDECYALLKHSQAVMEILVSARNDANIIFAADKI
jgi:Predicted dehydrogenases and related proteins